ncbi:MAG TPA: hypothetical protein VK155_13400 [Bacteroidales bacterium]|jgi:hypothetical protein|nr:hypothetical protein [Bacteroidales bacterium]
MKSDIIVKQFVDMLGRQINSELQDYLNGKNEWGRPVMEKDLISVHYNLSTIHNENFARKYPTTGILLLHRVPISEAE